MLQILNTSGFYDGKTVYSTKLEIPFIFIILIIAVSAIILLLTLIGQWKTFSKARQPGWACLVPIYNIIVMLKMTSMSISRLFFYLIPGLNIYMIFILPIKVAKSFNKSAGYGMGLLFLPFIYYPILGFGKAEYMGINNEANIVRLEYDPNQIVEDTPTTIMEEPIERKNVSVSTGSSYVTYTASVVPNAIKEEIKSEPELGLPTYADFRITNPEPIKETVPEIPKVEEKKEVPMFSGFETPVMVTPEQVSNIQNTTNDSIPLQSNVEITTDDKPFINTDPYYEMKVEEKHSTPDLSFIAPVDELPPEVKKVEEVKEEVFLGVPNMVGPDGDTDPNFVFCPRCNTKIKKGAKKCFICGADLN